MIVSDGLKVFRRGKNRPAKKPGEGLEIGLEDGKAKKKGYEIPLTP